MGLIFDTSDLAAVTEQVVAEVKLDMIQALAEVGNYGKAKVMARYASGNKPSISEATRKRRRSAGISGDIGLYATGQLAGNVIYQVTGGEEPYVDIKIAQGAVYAPRRGYGSPKSLQQLAEGFEAGEYGLGKWKGSVWGHVFDTEQEQFAEIINKYL